MSQIEISQVTLSEMIKIADRVDSTLKPRLEDLEKRLRESGDVDHGAAFFYDRDIKNNRSNSDCSIYLRSRRGVVEKNRPLLSLGSPTCDDKATSLLIVFWHSVDKMASTTMAPLEKFYLSYHPSKQISSEHQQTGYSNLFIGLTYHDLPPRMIPKSIATIFPLSVPVREHVVQQAAPLASEAERITGTSQHWPAIWTLNTAAVPDPYLVPRGTKLFIPVRPTGWKSVSARDSNIEIARKTYGDAVFEPLVSLVRSKSIGSSLGRDFPVPIFEFSTTTRAPGFIGTQAP